MLCGLLQRRLDYESLVVPALGGDDLLRVGNRVKLSGRHGEDPCVVVGRTAGLDTVAFR